LSPRCVCFQREEVTYLDRIRAVCGILGIGRAAEAIEARGQSAHAAAIAAIRLGMAFKESPLADSVESFIPAQPASRPAVPAGQAGKGQ
jgi:hypothetical protein